MLEYSFGLQKEAAAVNRAWSCAELRPSHGGFETGGPAGHDFGSRRRGSGKSDMKPRTIIEKSGTTMSWRSARGRRRCCYIDLHLVHEVTSPQAFDGLRARGLKVRRPDLTIATTDHSTPTTPRSLPIVDKIAATQVAQLETAIAATSAFAAMDWTATSKASCT
jgi:hypothetical protein